MKKDIKNQCPAYREIMKYLHEKQMSKEKEEGIWSEDEITRNYFLDTAGNFADLTYRRWSNGNEEIMLTDDHTQLNPTGYFVAKENENGNIAPDLSQSAEGILSELGATDTQIKLSHNLPTTQELIDQMLK